MRAALVLCCVVVGDKQAWCDVLWGRICGTWRVWWSMVRGGCGVCKCEDGGHEKLWGVNVLMEAFPQCLGGNAYRGVSLRDAGGFY
ncbi:hypothetical protein [Bartonella sp. MM73XJBT]|uniref:hypothetical protein n=1 Tax=Bartonella sp. MM73XJBT TaxID=3019095 RepID=UPI0023605B57|nr:hypothetical protein [Bartonella sp. MM73XJBT]